VYLKWSTCHAIRGREDYQERASSVLSRCFQISFKSGSRCSCQFGGQGLERKRESEREREGRGEGEGEREGGGEGGFGCGVQGSGFTPEGLGVRVAVMTV